MSAGYGILLFGMVAYTIVLGVRAPRIGWIGLNSIFFLFIYLWGMRMIFVYEKKRHSLAKEDEVKHEYADISKTRAYSIFGILPVTFIGTSIWLPYLGEKIAESTGLGETFVGTIFVSLSTALPELVISFSAVRIGAVDMALGNLFGSNLFNIGVLALDDVLYGKGVLLADVPALHLISVNAVIMMTAIAVVGLTYRTRKRFLFLAWDSLAIILVYLISTSMLFSFS